MTWLESILQAFKQCDGVGTPAKIIELTKNIRIQNGYEWIEDERPGHGPEYQVWAVVEAHCKGYKQCKSDPLFIKEDTENGVVWRLLSNNDNLIEQFKQEYLSGKYANFENEVKEKYANFNSKYALNVLAGLTGKDLLNTLQKLKDPDNLWHVLEKNKDYRRLFGAARIGNMNRFLLYCNSSGNWIKAPDGSAFNKTIVSESDAVSFAKDYIIKNLQIASDIINQITKENDVEDIDYLDMERQLKSQLKDFPIDYQWVRKYLHLIYPNYFPTFYSEYLINKVVKRISGTVNDDLWANMGTIVKFAKKCQIPNAVFAHIASDIFKLKDDENTKDDTMDTESKMNCEKIPLNQILYGAPGTGKTYKTIIMALEIITGEKHDLPADMEQRKKIYADYVQEFNKYRQNGQIEFITFHQSLGYEEFVEGIKPVMDDPDTPSVDLRYKVEAGIFKRIAERAGKETCSLHGEPIDFTTTRIFKMSLGKGVDNPIFEYCMENDVITNGYGKDIDFSGVKTREDIISRIGSYKQNDFNVEAMNRFILWMKPGDVVLIANGKSSIAAIAQVEGEYEYKDDANIEYNHFRKVKWLYKGEVPVTAFYNKKLSMMSIYAFYKQDKYGTQNYNTNIDTEYINELITGKDGENNNKKYVLIIDEINHGNISKIFGELITLLEPSKRIGGAEPLKTVLPYSQDYQHPFGVPNNLYVIGTMNTSDRSIVSVDIALRRRFEFIPMRPETDLISSDVAGIKLRAVVEKMNKKIEILLDEDHMIGHSYFLNLHDVDDVRDVWFKKIMPLINEYFYGDWEKIKMILGNDFVQEISMKDMPEDIRNYCNGETFYRFAKKDDLNDQDFATCLNKLA